MAVYVLMTFRAGKMTHTSSKYVCVLMTFRAGKIIGHSRENCGRYQYWLAYFKGWLGMNISGNGDTGILYPQP